MQGQTVGEGVQLGAGRLDDLGHLHTQLVRQQLPLRALRLLGLVELERKGWRQVLKRRG